eukprot:7051103-Pyramimonas_sp.AAC.1
MSTSAIFPLSGSSSPAVKSFQAWPTLPSVAIGTAAWAAGAAAALVAAAATCGGGGPPVASAGAAVLA